ncbi:MAG: hypothetical protein GX889_01955 [Clostridiales bacterium]|nr:hypothetical protein [Clostridiales bacterium]
MKIIKRTGEIEDFDLSKIKTSILNSSSDVNIPLNNSDINLLIREIEITLKNIRKLEPTTAYEVRGIVYHVLIKNGFVRIAKAYMSDINF